jgi:hypothetical protein
MVYTMSKRVNPTINAISSLIVGVITLVLIIINLVPFIRERSLMKKQKAAAAKAATTKAIETESAPDAKAPDIRE